MNNDMIFSRSRAILGEEGFERLKNAHVTVAGYGAVGSFAAEALARSGIGHLRIIDADIYEASNINRQLGAEISTAGMVKVEIGRRHIRAVNPEIDIEAVEKFIEADTTEIVTAPFSDGFRPEIVIDAIDTLDAKVSLLAAMVRGGTPVLSSMGAARKTMPELIRVADISKTEVCPLAREVRKRLRALGIIRGVTCVYSVEPARHTHFEMREEKVRRITKAPLGSLITVTGSFGLRLASECIEKLTAGRSFHDIKA